MDDSSQVRIEKINTIIGECRLAIHDVSRTELDHGSGLPRFNMPFEFGIFAGAKAFGGREQRRKACVVFDVERYRYQQFISDIAGQDIREHHGNAELLIQQVRDFLSCHHPSAVFLPGGRAIAARYLACVQQVTRSCVDLRLNRDALTYRDLANLIVGWIDLNPLPHHVHHGVQKAA